MTIFRIAIAVEDDDAIVAKLATGLSLVVIGTRSSEVLNERLS